MKTTRICKGLYQTQWNGHIIQISNEAEWIEGQCTWALLYPSTFNSFLKQQPSAEQKPTIKEWRVITQSGSRYYFTNEREAIKKHKALWAKGDQAQLLNVWS